MPIKVIKNTVNSGMRTLPSRLRSSAIGIAESVGKDSLKEVLADALNNKFWINRSYNAYLSINKEVEVEDDRVSVSIGFEKGKPNEKDAPGYYKSGRNRQYDEYISDRQETHFLANVLQILSRNVIKALGNFKIKTERASRISS